MVDETDNALVQAIRNAAYLMQGAARDYDPLIDLVGDARFVLLGEASHGTHEFYDARAQITKRLIEEKGFNAIAIEADWPDAYRINRYVRAAGIDSNSRDALKDFKRFPTWMWRNLDVLAFVEWLRRFNDNREEQSKTGLYGLDLYSMYSSMDAVLRYLEKVDPEAAARARYRYSCFDHFAEDPQAYGYAASFDLSSSCEQEALGQALELQKQAIAYAGQDGRVESDEFFFAQQNARLVKNAEQYYRSMFRGRVESWNNRDRHMAQTLEALVDYLSTEQKDAKVVVWAHNSHVGDARATEMGELGELNLGQLVRERYGRDALLVGFTTYQGAVIATSDWDMPPQQKRVSPALKNSIERVFHQTEIARFLLLLRDDAPLRAALNRPLLERAIGVIYRSETERQSHYFHVNLGEQFDAIVHFDDTGPVEPIGYIKAEGRDMAETFPTGI
ncbi:erythromycin esterase family protein [Eoetvoesiella caeni]|uniref:Erythromycin esterase-like protein n=1 Tax=Eoetvoesiella caeni TaxID=645616 RepID=A0A366HL13_9BURK|nr:erythromycin esterase family protein [Eoetvoesiella caeni]MCI2807681.1 erythromycin esterase family protein [Eoetvoesiella caeni]NYT52924.1 erythromycin esterase family protein [Eoetvoesiella caeni]RBP42901.1 erythromycin esterase-like protein [Eoetvoesiella caeni]